MDKEELYNQGLKKCSKCDVIKDHKDFTNSKGRWDNKYPSCKICKAKTTREARSTSYKKRHKNSMSRVKYLYGLTEGALQDMLNRQLGLCRVCKKSLVDPNSIKNYCIDHNHETGEVRGLLCDDCNVMLGRAKDNPDNLMRGCTYLLTEGYYGETN